MRDVFLTNVPWCEFQWTGSKILSAYAHLMRNPDTGPKTLSRSQRNYLEAWRQSEQFSSTWTVMEAIKSVWKSMFSKVLRSLHRCCRRVIAPQPVDTIPLFRIDRLGHIVAARDPSRRTTMKMFKVYSLDQPFPFWMNYPHFLYGHITITNKYNTLPLALKQFR